VLLPGGAATWTVIGGDGLSIEAAEEYLEYLRVSSSPNTVKSYARALALWWRWLQTTQVGWRDVGLSEFTGFVHCGGTPCDRSAACGSFDDPGEWVEGAIACRDAGTRRSRSFGS
jgi:hypothetical protein